MKDKILKGSFYGINAILIGILAFFIMYNAGWIIGDDAMIIRVTGWGHFFSPADTVSPSAGRFYPLAYTAYNILPILGLSSVNSHFALLTLSFIVFALISIRAIRQAIETDQLTWQDYVMLLSAGMVCMARVYGNFLDAFSTVWLDDILVMVWVLCCYYVHKSQSLTAMIIGLLSVTWLTYCLETNFVFPFAYGIIGLLFMWKKSTKLEKTYYWSLVGVGLIFLLLYFSICFLNIEEAYDGSHGSELTIIGNAINMFIAQKVLWVVLILVCWRAYRIIVKKEAFEFWDTMLLTGCAYCCGCAVMKLNWTLYYSLAVVFMIPATFHYLRKYLGNKWALVVMLAIALFTFRKVPSYIKVIQKGRMNSAEFIEIVTSEYKNGNILYWYAPDDDREWNYDLEMRTWLCACLQTQIGWAMNEEFYNLQKVNVFESNPGVYILSNENNKLFPNINDTVIAAGEILRIDETRNFTIVKIQ